MRRLVTHVIWYAAVNAFFVAVWVLTSGSLSGLEAVRQDPTTAVSAGFWPVWPILGWGLGVVIHLGVALPNALFGNRAVRRRRRLAKEAARTSSELLRDAGSAGAGIVREVGSAIDKVQERRVQRRADLAKLRGDHVDRKLHGEGERPRAPERRWVTVLFSDITDSTKLTETLGDEEWHRVLGRVRTIIRAALAARGGTEVGTQGDGTLARFSSPADAVLCAVDIQSALETAGASGEFIPGVRIGVHAGEAVEDEGDLVGRVINLASRVTDEAESGEIFVTEPVADQLVGKLELEDKGLRPLKGVAQPRHLLAVRWSDREPQT
ncbi:MAG: adenylate/guanylate cyclase domain-containing protein [Candidatus Binatia bacterium]